MAIAARSASITLLGLAIPLVVGSQDAAALYKEGLRLFSERQPQAAVAALRQSVALQPANALVWNALGVVHASQGDYESAEPAFVVTM